MWACLADIIISLPVESSQRSCVQEIPKMKEDLIGKQKQLDDVVGGELGLHKLWANITDMNKQVSSYSPSLILS